MILFCQRTLHLHLHKLVSSGFVQYGLEQEKKKKKFFDFIDFVTYIHMYYSGNVVVVVELIKDELFYRDFSRLSCVNLVQNLT